MSAPISGNFDCSRWMEVKAAADNALATAPHRSRWWKFRHWLSWHIRAPFVAASVVVDTCMEFVNSKDV